jgi:hypothetical protein
MIGGIDMTGKLIDAEKLKKHYAWWEDDERRTLFDQIVDAQPEVDAEPVIWCAECYFWDKEPSQTAMPEVHTCRYWRIGTTCIDYCGRASRDGWLKAIPKESKQ